MAHARQEKVDQAPPLMKSLGFGLGTVTVWSFTAELLDTGDCPSVEPGSSDLYSEPESLGRLDVWGWGFGSGDSECRGPRRWLDRAILHDLW